MPTKEEKDIDQEPVGIVISRGTRAEATPRLSAYVWGQFEEPATTPEPTEARAA
jgi:hypothetical protein